MAAGEHWLSNKGIWLLMQGQWDDATATAIKIGLLVGASAPAAHSRTSIQPVNTVGELLALSGFAEATGGWYSRVSLSRTNVAEDDANNRANLDAADVLRTSATVGQTLWGGFWYDATVDTTDTTRLLIGCYAYTTPIPTNGSNFTETISDLVRAVQP